MQTLQSQASLFKQNQIYWLDIPKQTNGLDTKGESGGKNKDENIQSGSFSVHIQRENGIIRGLQVVHKSGDSVSVDFFY